MTFEKRNQRVMRSIGDEFEHGKVQPQAVDFEEAILGAMMLESAGCSRGMELIKTGDVFYKDQHKVIFNAALLFLYLFLFL